MAQYRGAATKRGFNPKRVESQVSAINNQTNRTVQAMQEVRTQYAKNRANFQEQVEAGQRAVESQLDQNAKAEIKNAENRLIAVQEQARAEENQRRQSAKEIREVFTSLSNFSGQAAEAAALVALAEKERQDKRKDTLEFWGRTDLPDQIPDGEILLQDTRVANAISLQQISEATGQSTAAESAVNQATFAKASPSLSISFYNSLSPMELAMASADKTIEIDGVQMTGREAMANPLTAPKALKKLLVMTLDERGQWNTGLIEKSELRGRVESTVLALNNRKDTELINRSTASLKQGVEIQLFSPVQGDPEFRQLQINSNYQQAIQKIGFPALMQMFETRQVDSDGNLIGPTASELLQASIDAEGPGRPRMSPRKYAQLQAAEQKAIQNFQRANTENKGSLAEKLWSELQQMPEFDAIDINNPDSESSRRFIASMKKAFNDKDLPMPAAARQWIRDIESGTTVAEQAKYAEMVENPNSVEEDSYEEFSDPKLRRQVYDLWVKKTKGGYGSNYEEIKKQFEVKAADEAAIKHQPGSGDRVTTVESRAIERRLNTIFRAKFNEFIKKYPDDPDTAAALATEATLAQWAEFKKRDANDPKAEYYSSALGNTDNKTGQRVIFPNLVKFDEQATVSRKEARDAVKLAVKNDGLEKAVETVSMKLKPRLDSLVRRYEANPSDFSYPVEVTELAEITGKKPSDILNIMLEAADIDTIPDFEALKIIESDPELVKSMSNLYRTNVITQRAGAYASNTTSAYAQNGGGAVASLIMLGEGGPNSVNRGTAGDTPGGSQEVFGTTLDQVSVQDIMVAQQDGKVFAVGKWQIIPKTMLEWVNSGHPSAPKANEMFTSEVQGRFWNYVTQVKRPAIGAYLNGETSDPTEAAQALAREFASVGLQYAEGGRGRGESRYAGTGGNVAAIPPDRAIQALKQQRARNMGMTSNTSKEANATALMRYRKQVVAKPVMELASGQPGLDIYFEDKQFPVVMGGVVKEHGSEKGYGNFTIIESVDPVTGEKVDVLYSHLAQPSNLLVGSRVKSGELVGIQGGTGNVQSIDGTIASIDFLAPAPAGSKSMTPYMHYDALRRRVSANLGHPQ